MPNLYNQIKEGGLAVQGVIVALFLISLSLVQPGTTGDNLTSLPPQVAAVAASSTAPTVSAISPTYGLNESVVTLTGRGFYNAQSPNYTNVLCFKVGTICVNSYSRSSSDTQIRFTIPAKAALKDGTYSLTLATANGTTNLTQKFTVGNAPAPVTPTPTPTPTPPAGQITVTSISPSSGMNGSSITLAGTGFYDAKSPNYTDALCFRLATGGCVYAYAKPTSDTSVKFIVPAKLYLPGGAYSLVLTTPKGTLNLTQRFTVTVTGGTTIATSTPPITIQPISSTVSSISPASGAKGTLITLTGAGFYDAKNPYFKVTLCFKANNTCINAYNYPTSDSRVSFYVPATLSAGTYSLSITTARGTSDILQKFTVTGSPAPSGTVATSTTINTPPLIAFHTTPVVPYVDPNVVTMVSCQTTTSLATNLIKAYTTDTLGRDRKNCTYSWVNNRGGVYEYRFSCFRTYDKNSAGNAYLLGSPRTFTCELLNNYGGVATSRSINKTCTASDKNTSGTLITACKR